MITENLSTLKINKLSKEQYERALAAGNIDENALYLTPDEDSPARVIEDDTYVGCYYRMVDGEKEWINPPMITGVSYRTTERHAGNPVYIRQETLFALGSTAQTDIPENATIFDIHSVACESNSVRPLPYLVNVAEGNNCELELKADIRMYIYSNSYSIKFYTEMSFDTVPDISAIVTVKFINP